MTSRCIARSPAMAYGVASGVAATAEPSNAGRTTRMRLLASSETKTSPAALTVR
jgi:hypothetical protein